MNDLQLKTRNKVYFVSDFHLGVPNQEESLQKEKRIVRWLESIEQNAKEIFFLGDIFDFWFEYKYVVPKGFVRFLGKLTQMADNGCAIHFFCGNHDIWIRDYFEKDLGFIVHRSNSTIIMNQKTFLIGHGDGLDPSDKKYKLLNKIFKNRFCISLFACLHPRWAFAIGTNWSRKSRLSHSESDKIDRGLDEPIYKYCENKLKTQQIDFFIFGHRHISCDIKLSNQSRYINTGLWEIKSPYVEWDGKNLELKNFE